MLLLLVIDTTYMSNTRKIFFFLHNIYIRVHSFRRRVHSEEGEEEEGKRKEVCVATRFPSLGW